MGCHVVQYELSRIGLYLAPYTSQKYIRVISYRAVLQLTHSILWLLFDIGDRKRKGDWVHCIGQKVPKLQWFNGWLYYIFLFVYAVVGYYYFYRRETVVGSIIVLNIDNKVCDCIFFLLCHIRPAWSPVEMSYVQNSRSGRTYVLFLDTNGNTGWTADPNNTKI